jgi:hypothetical protein
MKLTNVIAAGALALCSAGAASASPVDVTLKFERLAGRKVFFYKTPTDQVEGDTKAGAIFMTDTSGHLGDFVAWCLDVAAYVGRQGQEFPYRTTQTPFSNSYGLSQDQQTRVQTMFDASFPYVDVTKGRQAAGFQLALWEVLYEGEDNDFNIWTGDFKAISADEKTNRKARKYLTKAKNFSYEDSEALYDLTFLESTGVFFDRRQNLVTVTPRPSGGGPIPSDAPPAVPLPGSGVLLVFGLIGLGVAARRRKRA